MRTLLVMVLLAAAGCATQAPVAAPAPAATKEARKAALAKVRAERRAQNARRQDPWNGPNALMQKEIRKAERLRRKRELEARR